MPATNATANATGMSVAAVPRSGCLAMMKSGTAVIAPTMMRSTCVTAPRRLSPRNLASTSASAALANSDGWRLNEPRSIQRRDPPRTAPKNSTYSSSAMIADVDEVRLVRHRPVVDAEADDQGDEAKHHAVNLRLDDRRPSTRGAVDLGDADDAERQHRGQQPPVHVVIQTAFEHDLVGARHGSRRAPRRRPRARPR